MLSVAAFAGALVWLIALRLPLFAEAGTARVALGALVVAGYTFCIAYELGRERRKSLYSRTAAIVVPSLHAGIFLLPLAMRALLPGVLAQAWLAVFALEIMIYAIGAAFIVLLMVKDHYVHIYRSAASTDGLTGLLNRRAFLEGALALCGLQAKRREAVSLLMFDLDHFKSVNDRFGHAAGDDLLKLFAQTARRCMRADDIIGRFGGEEFVAIVPGDLRIAARIAERVRSSFEQAGAKVGALPIGATVSIGIAMACEPVMEVGALLVRADGALYRAKHDGRNRVFAAGDDGAGDTGRFISAVRLAPPAPAERQKDAA
jgi:diguanylate cyclase (GGDEF)-like protein